MTNINDEDFLALKLSVRRLAWEVNAHVRTNKMLERIGHPNLQGFDKDMKCWEKWSKFYHRTTDNQAIPFKWRMRVAPALWIYFSNKTLFIFR